MRNKKNVYKKTELVDSMESNRKLAEERTSMALFKSSVASALLE